MRRSRAAAEPMGADMARLIVEAISEDAIAAPGNRQANYVIVSVTKGNGQPVSGLTAANFNIEALIVGAGGALTDITAATERSNQGNKGIYFIDLVPIRTETWKAGVYIFGVVVKRGPDHGQTLTTVIMD
jgi:hypothetical protein